MGQKLYKNGAQLNPLSDALFLAGVMLTVLFPSILVAAYFGTVYFTLFFIGSSLGVVLGLSFYVLKTNSDRQKELLRVLKTQHEEFFQQIRLNVVLLLDKKSN